MSSPSIFISYSHKDEKWKDRLIMHLRVFETEGIRLDVWDDRRIEAGDDWQTEIENAINMASISILIISPNFLTSKFILNEEVPKLIDRRVKEGARIILMIVKPCAWQQIGWLSKIQGIPKDNRPLSGGNEDQIDADLTVLANEITRILRPVDLETLSLNLELKHKKESHDSIELSNLNVFMHEHPELTPQILAELSKREALLLDAKINIIQADIIDYIEKQKSIHGKIDPAELTKIIQETINTTLLQFPNISDEISKESSIKIEGEVNKSTIIIGDGNEANDSGKNQEPTPPNNRTFSDKTDEKNKEYKISISWPALFSKRFTSLFLCQIYLPENRSQVTKNIKLDFQKQPFKEEKRSSNIKYGNTIIVKLQSEDFSFSEPIKKTIQSAITKFVFLGKPHDGCETGNQHVIKIFVLDAETGEEIDFVILNGVRVVDFAFDHISRPLLSKISTLILGLSSFVIFILTFLEQLDKTIGLTSGTATGLIAAAIYSNFYSLYQRIRLNTP